jgi:hypothetical protein
MLFFGSIFAAGIVAVLALQKMDIECLNPPEQNPAPRLWVRARSVELRPREWSKPFPILGKKARA